MDIYLYFYLCQKPILSAFQNCAYFENRSANDKGIQLSPKL